MITIRPSTIPDDATPSPGSAASDPEEHKKRIPLVWIPITLGVGLLIAAIYLRGRIVITRSHAKPAIAQVSAPVQVKPAEVKPLEAKPAEAKPAEVKPAEVKPAAVTPALSVAQPALAQRALAPPSSRDAEVPKFVGPELTLSAPADGIPMIEPHKGELYVQVGALNTAATLRMVQRMRNEKLDPHVAPGPKPELLRVLIGPFDTRDALNARKAQLESEGVDTFVRQY